MYRCILNSTPSLLPFLSQITWSLTGPDPGREREDIDSNTLGGILTLQNGQRYV